MAAKPKLVTVLLMLIMAAAPAQAGITIITTANIPAGIAAFGPATPLLTWDNVSATTGIDPGTGASAAGSIAIRNWINGPGFGPVGAPENDLAINVPENFMLNFAAPVSRIGFAISTGLGLLPGEVSAASTGFTLRTSNGDSAAFDLINPGAGLALWVDLRSDTPFTSLQFTETSSDITDQYFGNVVAGNLPTSGAVPEPASWALLMAGFGLVGAVQRRRSQSRTVTA